MAESPVIQKSWKKGTKSLAIVYPNLYFGGVYCLAPLIFYNIVNQKRNWICERKFLDKCSGLKNFNLIGFTFQYELDYFNFPKILRKNNINLNKKGRKEIIFAGGPCVNLNPFTLSRYIDFFLIGECEEVIRKVLETYEEDDRKDVFLENVAKIKGVYVPGISKKITMDNVDINKVSYPVYQPLPKKMDKKFVFGRSFLLETERGCPFKCKFCTISDIYPRVKYRRLEIMEKILEDGLNLEKRDKVVMYSPSFTNPSRKELLRYLIKKKIKFSVPSLRLEFADEELLNLIKKGGQRSLTIAPEANESLRKLIGKNIRDGRFFEFIKLANKANFENIKMYFMIGLPNQKEKDLVEMIDFIKKCNKLFNRKVYVSINPLVPKPKTRFSNLKFDARIVKKQAKYLHKNLKIRMKISDVKAAEMEHKLAYSRDLNF